MVVPLKAQYGQMYKRNKVNNIHYFTTKQNKYLFRLTIWEQEYSTYTNDLKA